jgi:hypothetical protein
MQAELADHAQINGWVTCGLRVFALVRYTSDFLSEGDPDPGIIVVISICHCHAVENRPRGAGEFLNIEGSFVAFADFGLSSEAGQIAIVPFRLSRLDWNLLVHCQLAGVQIIDLLKNFSVYREVNDYLRTSCHKSERGRLSKVGGHSNG